MSLRFPTVPFLSLAGLAAVSLSAAACTIQAAKFEAPKSSIGLAYSYTTPVSRQTNTVAYSHCTAPGDTVYGMTLRVADMKGVPERKLYTKLGYTNPNDPNSPRTFEVFMADDPPNGGNINNAPRETLYKAEFDKSFADSSQTRDADVEFDGEKYSFHFTGIPEGGACPTK